MREEEGACYFLTFRLADSLPSKLLERFREERDAWLRFHPKPWDEKTESEYHKRFSASIDRWLDAGHGECRLSKPAAREIVSRAFLHFDADRYLLHAFVVMPNHVHLLVSLSPAHDLKTIVTSWKTFTARRINALDGRVGPFWQRDYFDRLVRNAKHFRNVVRYIKRNAEHCPGAVLHLAPWIQDG